MNIALENKLINKSNTSNKKVYFVDVGNNIEF